MKKLLLFVLLFPVLTYAQYNQEITTEESFENSELFFNSYYLNTFGMRSFKEAAPGYINDPFLNLYINPANVPDLGEKTTLIYLDFAGDREESEIVGIYPQPYYYTDAMYYAPVQDPRWLTNSRQEPGPIASLGLLTYPLGDENRNLFIGGTYQLIHKEENFYTLPYWIYNSRYYYDAFGNGVMEDQSSYPVIDRYSGQDEMITSAHLLSAFAGYKISDDLSAGISINGIIHSRSGSYLNQSQDEYGNIDYNDWSNYSMQERNQDYSHYDLAFGIKYNLTSSAKLGVKAGVLNGTAEQDYTSINDYFSDYNNPADTTRLSYYYSTSDTYQTWKHDGSSKYFSLIFNRYFDDVTMTAYYKLTDGRVDLTSSSFIADTSYHYYKYSDVYYSYYSESSGNSSTHDIRSGSGTKDKLYHEAAINFNWELKDNISFSAGVYFASNSTETSSIEPVNVTRFSEYYYIRTNNSYDNDYYYLQQEDKILEWNYKSSHWTFQVPLMLRFGFNEFIEGLIGVNRTLSSWKIENSTLAIFNYRDRIENGSHTREDNFGERYTQPTRNCSDNHTDFIAGLKVKISPQLKINLLVDPEFENSFRFAQWQLSFYGYL